MPFGLPRLDFVKSRNDDSTFLPYLRGKAKACIASAPKTRKSILSLESFCRFCIISSIIYLLRRIFYLKAFLFFNIFKSLFFSLILVEFADFIVFKISCIESAEQKSFKSFFALVMAV